MPRVKIDYVVSFSSEDPDNPVSNLLEREVTKKKWLCTKGEPSVSVVLQLARAVQICAVHIGAYQSALVEVLVGRSEKPDDPFEVLVPSSVFLSPSASRRDEATELVRSFSGEQLAAPAKDHKWDRVRVVCSQPYNKHCKYGLGFVQLYEPEGAAAAASAVPARLLPLQLPSSSSDEEDFRPGELFAKHSQGGTRATDIGPSVKVGADAQIRQASSQALRNMPGACPRLHKAPIAKPPHSRPAPHTDAARHRNDDDKPHAKIDRLVEKHREQRSKEDAHNGQIGSKKEAAGVAEKRDKRGQSSHSSQRDSDASDGIKKRLADVNDTSKAGGSNGRESIDKPTQGDRKKRPRTDSSEDYVDPGPSAQPQSLLADVVAVLSGYQNPERAAVRATALALGASVRPDWGPQCTHLICAFPNTPKLRALRGQRVPVATAAWLRDCARLRRRLPWRWFATDARLRQPRTPLPEPEAEPEPDPDCDTDDDIQEVLRARPASEGRGGRGGSDASDAYAASTDEEADDEVGDGDGGGGALPDFFDGYTFVADRDSLGEVDVTLAERYIRAYGGVLLEAADGVADYAVSAAKTGPGAGAGARHWVRPSWLWRCHARRALLPPPTQSE